MKNANTLPEKQYEFSAVLNEAAIRQLASEIKAVWSDFDAPHFCEATFVELEGKAIKARANWVAQQLHHYLPKEFSEAGAILLAVFQNEVVPSDTRPFRYMPCGEYVGVYGLAEQNLDLSARLLYAMTSRFSAEFAIRPFIKKYPLQMLKYLQTWVNDDNKHVRRLVSEGTRPRLPWAGRLNTYAANYSVIWDLLSQLQADTSLYVRRSVANHLNDCTKEHPEKVVELLQQWQAEQGHEQLDWVIRHSLRTLIKKGHPAALNFLGYGQTPVINIENFQVAFPNIPLGTQQEFSFDLVSTSDTPQPLLIDYVLYFMKANGQQSPKVFKLKTLTLEPRQRLTLKKKHWLKHFSTRQLYAGTHRIELQVNGQVQESLGFDLVFP